MRIGLVSTKQNELYDFTNQNQRIKKETALQLQKNMIEQTLNYMESACKEGCDIVVSPEAMNFCGIPTWLEGNYEDYYLEMPNQLVDKLSYMAKKYHTYLFAGVITKRVLVGEKMALYNSCLIYGPNGRLINIYDKVHLTPDEKDWFEPGSQFVITDTDMGKIGLGICWDMQQEDTCRVQSAQGARLIVCPTWGWESGYGHKLAKDNNIYIASAMGIPYDSDIEGIRNPSELVNCKGEVVKAFSRSKSVYLICEVVL